MRLAENILAALGRMILGVDKAVIEPIAGPIVRTSSDKSFAKDVDAVLSSLLKAEGAAIVANDEADNDQPRLFDMAIVTISGPGLRLRLVRVRGELDLRLSSPDGLMEWTDVDRLVLSPEDPAHEEPQHNWNDQDLPAIRDFLQRYWPRLEDLASRKALK